MDGRRRYGPSTPILLNEYCLTLDRHAVLTWVSIYWFSRSGPASSVRIYYELKKVWFPETTVPVGVSFFAKELVRLPTAYVFVPSESFLFFVFEILKT